MGWRDLFGGQARSTEDVMAEANAARPAEAPADPDGRIAALVADGEKIEAIKLHREVYGTSLVDAKDAIDAISRGETPVQPEPVQSEPVLEAEGDARVRALIDQGRLIDAIKLYRELHDVGLKEAKDAVDAMRA